MEKDTYCESKNWQNNPKIIRSFGRIKSRKLSDHKKNLLINKLKEYQIFDFAGSQKINHLEIGFGFGDFIFNKANQNPTINFYGCEPHLNGVVHLLGMLEKKFLPNLKIINNDLRLIIDKIPDNFFEKIYILFPDPWPKSKHFKRRLINTDFLDNSLARILTPNGKIIIATDHDSYKTWILSNILSSKKFNWLANSKNSWQNFPNDWIETKYQKKARAEGRNSILIEIIKYDR
ncbi:MAG: tRNA (guanosine(46)-N7)-methyltransferase TrmB [Proteobacteria bacterium]|nr:tRNA (guanosine(46)-N7)-methyltransferase TrmB [Pseudomonadota bacterium]